MALDKDFNDILDDIVMSEDSTQKESYTEGFTAGVEGGNSEGFHLGYHKGARLGKELGYYLGIANIHLERNANSDTKYPDKIIKQLEKLKDLINSFPHTNSEEHDIVSMADNIRVNYKKACALLKISSVNPYETIPTKMDTSMKVRENLDSIMSYLTPLLPIANCHMVEFFTDKHWEHLLPHKLRKQLENMELNKAVNRFWDISCHNDSCEITKWVKQSQCHHVSVNEEYCISPQKLTDIIHKRGGNFEAGFKKQWHAIAKRANGGANVWTDGGVDTNLHRFACSYITRDTDLSSVVREQFDCEEVNLLLTGLHTCGDLGPSCLRLFTVSPAVRVLFNVPCCYHLLSEAVDVAMFDDDQTATDDKGFPMSQYLRGLNLGRNARMLGAQSIDRVRHYRQMPDRSLLYRALLQGFASKCQSFQQYFKMADEKLGLNIFNSLPECYLIELERTMDCQWKKIVLLYLMRLCLAQVIEGVILLDRLLYLYECGCKNAYLVKLFDPVLSPRCHSIVAIRN
ncbi:unnamed protein product, partial [Leptidea sinapis]